MTIDDDECKVAATLAPFVSPGLGLESRSSRSLGLPIITMIKIESGSRERERGREKLRCK